MSFESEIWSLLSDATRKTIRHLEKLGAGQAEGFFLFSRTTETNIRNSEIFTENAIEDVGVSFRAATSDNRVGFACTNDANSEAAILEAGEKALAIANLSAPVPGFSLPSKRKITEVEGLYDKAVLDVRVEDCVDIARRLIQSAESVDKRVTAKGGQVVVSYLKKGVINSLGVDVEAPETHVVAYLYGNGSQNNEITPSCFEGELKRNFSLDPEKIGETTGRTIITLFNSKPIVSFEGSAVFEPEAVSYQLCNALIGALKGENVVAGGSAWTEKIGEMVGSGNLTVLDDATLKDGFASRYFDDEGYPSQQTPLISKGVLRSFLHDTTTANRLKMENTGNASRFTGGFDIVKSIVGSGYKAKPEVYPSNLVIESGSKTKDELIAEVDKGVLVGSMAGFVQPSSGLISAQLSRAYYVENGELKHPIKGGMLTGIAFDWFKQVEAMGNDKKQFFNSSVPSLLVKQVKIIGS
jgi:PmbA protein